MADFTGTPLATKLGVKPNSTLVILRAPITFSVEVPPKVVVRRRAIAPADVVMVFVTRAELLRRDIETLSQSIFPNGALWVAWPKKASGVSNDITDHVVRQVALPLGLVDNKVCAIDEYWTGLRLVWRSQNRQ